MEGRKRKKRKEERKSIYRFNSATKKRRKKQFPIKWMNCGFKAISLNRIWLHISSNWTSMKKILISFFLILYLLFFPLARKNIKWTGPPGASRKVRNVNLCSLLQELVLVGGNGASKVESREPTVFPDVSITSSRRDYKPTRSNILCCLSNPPRIFPSRLSV